MSKPLFFCTMMVSLAACNRDQGIESDDQPKDSTSNNSGGNNSSSSDNPGSADVDEDTVGDDIYSASEVTAWEEIETWGADYLAMDAIDEPGDRDFYSITTNEGYDYLIATAAFVLTEQTIPDTVLRLYDQDGNLLLTNDDMPFRFWETDSALWFQATYTGTYYIEVLEFSDWAEIDSGPEGGSEYEYQLWGWETYYSELAGEGPNGTQEEADELYTKVTESEDLGLYYSSWFDGFIDDSYAQYISNIYGHISDEEDVDVWRFDVDYSEDEDDWGWMTWTSFATANADFTPRMSLYNGNWEVLASTTDWGYTGRYYTIYDTDLAYPVTTGTYYLVIEDDAGYGGLGTLYAINRLTWLGSLAMQETEDNGGPFSANRLEMTESTSTAGYFYGRAVGHLGADDALDTFKISADDVGGSLAGKYLNVALQAQGVGSFLDAKLVIYGADGTEILTEVTETEGVEGQDPYVLNYQFSSAQEVVYISVEAEALGESDPSNFYLMGAYLSNEPE